MKKTLIAASIAALVAAPAAFADVSISGQINQDFVSDSDDTGVDKDGLDSDSNVDIVFKASEDLGNGMSAFATIHYMTDDGSFAPDTQMLGLKGDFGSIMVGRMEDFTESKVQAMANNDASDVLSIEFNGDYDTPTTEGGIAYVSPSFNGLTFGIAGYALSNGGAASVSGESVDVISGGASYTVAINTSAAVSKDATGNIDATDIMVEYANGPLLVRASYEVMDKTVFNKDQTTAKDQKSTSIGAQYTMGDITLTAAHFDVDNGGGTDTNDVSGYFVGAKMVAGANTFAIGYSEEDDVDSSAKSDGKDKNMLITASHAFSKRTSAYVGFESNDDPDAGKDRDMWAVGMKHSF
jgi:predicted porin